MSEQTHVSRRDFLKLAGGAVVAASLSGLPLAVTAQGDEVTLVFWSPNCDVECEQINIPEWMERFRQEVNGNVNFELSGAPWGDYWTRLPLALAGGTGPDLYFFHANWMQQFVDGGLVEAWPEERVAQLREVLDGIDPMMINGKLYAFNEGLDTNVIYYGKKAWEDAGLTDDDIPTTWDELVALADALTERDSNGAPVRAGFDANLRDGRWTWVALKYQMGEFLISEDGRRANIHTEGGQKAAQMLWDWEFGENPVGNIDLAPWTEDALPTEIAAMGFGFGWFADYWRSDYPDYEWGAFPLPAVDGAPAISKAGGWTTMAVNAQASDAAKSAAFDVIQWHGTDPDLMRFRALGGQVPTLRSLREDPDILASPVVSSMLANIDKTVFFGFTPPDFESALAQITDLMFVAQTSTVDEALAEAQLQADEILARAENVYWGFQERTATGANEMVNPEIVE
ncbi:MAG: extracellular solute-binding protein [Anaerolineaceae bacterium]|nr:extracellular solute-binding protein [Anaerolineaceae bacterium]